MCIYLTKLILQLLNRSGNILICTRAMNLYIYHLFDPFKMNEFVKHLFIVKWANESQILQYIA